MSIEDKLLGAAAAGGITPSENFTTVLYDGNSSTQVITGVGFQPDWVWIKQRDVAVENHNLIDSTRGTSKIISSNLTGAEFTSTRFTSFDTDGFTLANNNETNDSGSAYVAWCWKANGGTTATNSDGSFDVTVQANIDAGFSIITYTGQGSDATYGHGLDSAPEFLFTKTRSHTSDWPVYSSELTSAAYRIVFNSINAENTDNNPWNSTAPTDSVISIKGDAGNVNTSGRTYVTYAFHSISGFSKFGSYVGNGNANGPIVETGFEVGWLMMKNRDDTEGGGASWNIYDNKRNTSNPRDTRLWANANSAEYSAACYDVDFLANGFQIAAFCSTYGMNEDGDTYIYMAFAADPDTEQPTLADSFGIKAYSGTGSNQSITGYGFAPNFLWLKQSSGTEQHYAYDTIRGYSKYLHPNLGSAEGTDTSSRLASFDADGFSLFTDPAVNGSGSDYIAWAWKANDDVPTIEAVNTDTDAIAIYKFEDNVDDVTGNYDGTATSISYVTGKFNKAADFNGSSSKITSTPGITGNAVFSISFWIKPEAVNGTPFLFGTTTAGQAFLTFVNSSNKLNFGSWGDSLADSIASIPLSTWTNVVISNNAGSVQVYINGATDVSFSNTFNITGDNLCLGAANTSQYFEGELDQVRLYDKALTAASATNLYNETTAQNDTLDIGTQYQSSVTALVSVNANAGFSIVKYTATGVTMTVPHGLSSAPDLIIGKTTNQAYDWLVYHTSLGNASALSLQSSAAAASNSFMNSTSPTSTVFTAGGGNNWNYADGNEIIAYCFHSVSGYSKFGGPYSGNSSTQSITGLGFQPDYVMIKRTDGTENWYIQDSVRGSTEQLYANITNPEFNETTAVTSFDSDGFTMGSYSGINNTGADYIYIAFKMN